MFSVFVAQREAVLRWLFDFVIPLNEKEGPQMWHGYEWPVFLRFWTETLDILVRGYAERKDIRSAKLLPEVVSPVIPGIGIVMSVSFLERVILDALRERGSSITWVKLNRRDWAEELGMDMSWPGWPLIDVLTRLRHCFAHEYGRATQRQIEPLRKRRIDLEDEPINITWGSREYTIRPFFSVNPESEEVMMETPRVKEEKKRLSPSQSIRIIILSFLEELEKVNVVDLKAWRDGKAEQPG